MPKNYSCETVTQKVKGMYSISFTFGLRILLKSGHILNQKVPINVYRLQPPTLKNENDENDE